MPYEIICIGGPCGAGKDTLVEEITKVKPQLIRVPRYTNRPIKPGEKDKINHIYLSEKEFAKLKRKGEINLVDNFYKYQYGVNIQSIDDLLRKNKRLIGIFGVCSLKLKEIFPKKTILIYVTADPEQLLERMRHRNDSEKEIWTRFEISQERLEKEIGQFDYVVHNNTSVETAVKKILKIIA